MTIRSTVANILETWNCCSDGKTQSTPSAEVGVRPAEPQPTRMPRDELALYRRGRTPFHSELRDYTVSDHSLGRTRSAASAVRDTLPAQVAEISINVIRPEDEKSIEQFAKLQVEFNDYREEKKRKWREEEKLCLTTPKVTSIDNEINRAKDALSSEKPPILFLMTRGEKPIGISGIGRTQGTEAAFNITSNFFVIEEERRQGTGTKLLIELMNKVTEQGGNKLTLLTEKFFPGAENFYIKNGFQPRKIEDFIWKLLREADYCQDEADEEMFLGLEKPISSEK